MATQTIDMSNVDTCTFNNQNVNEIYLNSGKIWPAPSFDPIFGNNSPSVISSVSQTIAAQNMTASDVYNTYGWSLGDTVSITLTTNEVIQMQIIGINHDTLSSDHTSKAGLTLQMVNCLATLYPINDSNTTAGGWQASKMRVTTMPILLALLPDEWQGVIKTVDKKSANGGGSYYSATVTSEDKLFLLAEIEIFGTVSSARYGANEGSQYAYWVAHNSYADKKKYYDNAGTPTAIGWWERSSAVSPYQNYFCCVASFGSSSMAYPSGILGVSFAFCV